MAIVDLSKIEIRKRQRTTMDPKKLQELQDSIAERGLLHPPVCWHDPDTDTWVLVVGERRLTAMKKLSDLGIEYRHSVFNIQPGQAFITPLSPEIDEIIRFELEFDENIKREDLTWQDRCKALSALHDMRLAENPKQSLAATGREIASAGVPDRKTGAPISEHAAAENVRTAVIVAKNLNDPLIANARNENEAISLFYKREEEKVRAALARRQLTKRDSDIKLDVRLGDATIILPTLEPALYDLILTDPPYGMGANSAGFRARTLHHHNYDDNPDNARSIARSILTEGFRLTRPRANLFMFCDIGLFDWLCKFAANMGWTPFTRPLIWQKSESEGLAPWGSSGPRLTTEFIFYATKGQRGMNLSPTDVFNVKRVSRSERLHAAEKPVELLKQLIECTTLIGESVLDPCCGSGSTLVACRELKRHCLGLELDPNYYNTACSNALYVEPTP